MVSGGYVVGLLLFYGLFLIFCGIVSVVFIGMKAKTALASGGLSGLFSIGISWLIYTKTNGADYGGIVLSLALFCVFAWRSTKTLFTIFEMINANASISELKPKRIAFLIISLMAVVSIVVFGIQSATIFSTA